jgi:hypothetical protein
MAATAEGYIHRGLDGIFRLGGNLSMRWLVRFQVQDLWLWIDIVCELVTVVD